jgi:hypothetical protein
VLYKRESSVVTQASGRTNQAKLRLDSSKEKATATQNEILKLQNIFMAESASAAHTTGKYLGTMARTETAEQHDVVIAGEAYDRQRDEELKLGRSEAKTHQKILAIRTKIEAENTNPPSV